MSSETRKSVPYRVELYGMEEFSRPLPRGKGAAVASPTPGLSNERDAYEKGYKAGEEAGYAFGSQKAKLVLARMESIARELSSFQDRLIASIEPEVVALSIDIAQKIIQEEIKVNPDVVLNVAREALKRVANWKEITVRVNPADLDYMKERGPDLVEGNRAIHFQGDPSIQPGGCLIQEEYGEIDARIDQQIEEIREELTG